MLADFTGLIGTIKQASLDAVNASNPAAVMFGSVTSVSPLKINVEQKMTLERPQLVLSRNVTDYTVEMTLAHSTENALNVNLNHSHSYNGSTNPGGDTSHAHGYSGSTSPALDVGLQHNHTYTGKKQFTIHNGLEEGDEVILIRLQGGQKFLVIDRLG